MNLSCFGKAFDEIKNELQQEIEQLKAELKRYTALHESELGICEQHCDVVQHLKSIVRQQTDILKMVAVNHYLGFTDSNRVEFAVKLGEGV